SKVNNDIVDCLGGSDERQICRIHAPDCAVCRFLCRSFTNPETMYIKPYDFCNKNPTCSFYDDEIFCLERNFTTKLICDNPLDITHTNVETFLCGLTDSSKKSIVYFLLYFNEINMKIHHDSNNILEQNKIFMK
ncbi:unnamed protein product, partial [Rotaria sp. Silwood2]